MRILRKVIVPAQLDQYELFHDVLGSAILEWRARYVQSRQLSQQRAEAEKKLTFERQKSKRWRWAVVAIGTLLFLMTAVTAFAFQQQREAK